MVSMTNRPKRHHYPRGNRERSLLLDDLHALIHQRLSQYEDAEKIARDIEDNCWALWMLSQTEHLSPHVCRDMYCQCHLELAQHRPETLPDVDWEAEKADWAW